MKMSRFSQRHHHRRPAGYYAGYNGYSGFFAALAIPTLVAAALILSGVAMLP
jgi:hypothetical protein